MGRGTGTPPRGDSSSRTSGKRAPGTRSLPARSAVESKTVPSTSFSPEAPRKSRRLDGWKSSAAERRKQTGAVDGVSVTFSVPWRDAGRLGSARSSPSTTRSHVRDRPKNQRLGVLRCLLRARGPERGGLPDRLEDGHGARRRRSPRESRSGGRERGGQDHARDDRATASNVAH